MERESKMLERIVDWYFEPKGFEKRGKLYEALGVKIWSKYCPNGGSWLSKNSMIDGHSKEELKKFLTLTKILEGTHTIAFFPFFYWMCDYLSQGDYDMAAYCAISNTLINVYPVISMRYNRNRVNKILKKRYKI